MLSNPALNIAQPLGGIVNITILGMIRLYCNMNKKEENITQMIKSRIKQKNPYADIILFGSHARGQSTKIQHCRF